MISFASLTLTLIGLITLIRWIFSPPASLAHLPRAPMGPLLLSYISGEVEDRRVKRILLPYAAQVRSDILLVWVLGTWMVYVLEYNTAKPMMENRQFRKQLPAKDMLLWRLIGPNNIFLAEGEVWRRLSELTRNAIKQAPSVDVFVPLSQKVLDKIGPGGTILWNDFTHRFTLDAVGLSVMGHDFRALEFRTSDLVQQYHDMMHQLSNPIYAMLPLLERYLPRRRLIRNIDSLRDQFSTIIQKKRKEPQDDIVSRFLQESNLSDQEILDTVITFFMAGHDTTAGSLSSLICFFAIYPEYQQRARDEVGKHCQAEFTIDSLSKTTFLDSCIRECLRANSPSTMTIPRSSQTLPISLGGWNIPPNVPLVFSIVGVLHNTATWGMPVFDPERFDPSLNAPNVEVPAWVPFGMGHRRCPAKNFSLLEQRTLAAMLLSKYKWTLPEGSIHRNGGIRNAFSAFALSLPYNVEVTFAPLVGE